ncbi:MAG: 4-deoxy-4-formamido-L-arabinose-phosphoundecaprenol deformylase [Planctomycetes bacterium]|nr:4-deoxy-4-formamido-L-arabinose-phosphoundecaprenol deformylase [Planctomycetota bacterium]
MAAETLNTRLALKIDADTFRGTRDGVPGLLEELDRAGVKASFFLTLGPDNSGKAVLRVLRKKGFLGKMLRTNAIKMYGFSTLFYGTLLPAPRIGQRLAGALRSIESAGHEVNLHAWDHVRWQDRLDHLSPEEIEAELARGAGAFAEIFGRPPRAFAAPAWFCTEAGFLALEKQSFDYLSVTRGPAPFRPRAGGRALSLLEIPTTLPTLDEALGRDGVTEANWIERLIGRYRPGQTEVLTVHAETEGLAYRPLFRDLLARHRDRGVIPITLAEVARELGEQGPLPEKAVALCEIPGRAGKVAVPAAG